MAMKQTDVVATEQKEEGRQQGKAQDQQGKAQDQGAAAREGRSRQDNRLARLGGSPFITPFMSPFALLQRFFSDDIASLIDEIGGHRGSMKPQSRDAGADLASFVPKIDLVQRGNELVVRADLPGVSADDVVVEVSDDALTISGERRQERAEEDGGIYRFERTYGAFSREIPLPEGAIVDQAKATFKNGVLEVTVPAPPEQVSRGRRLEIARDDTAQKSDANKEGAQNQAGR